MQSTSLWVRKSGPAAVLLSAALFFVGCDGNPVDAHDDHADVEGVSLVASGATLVTVEEAVVSGTIAVAAGSETALIQAKWLDHDGNEVHEEDLDAAYTLQVTTADQAVAEIEQHASYGRFRFHVVGVSAGSTTITVKLMHSDHADFLTPPIPVNVN
jgi:hypothetical protein